VKGRRRAKPIDNVDRAFGAIGGTLVGSFLGMFIMAALLGGRPFDGLLGIAILVLPGMILGGILGALFPRVFIFLGDNFLR
jgi:hypothetical protein